MLTHFVCLSFLSISQSRELNANLFQTHVLPANKTLGHKEAIIRVAFSHDSQQVLTASIDSKIMLWDVGTNLRTQQGNSPYAPVRTYEGHKEKVLSICWQENGNTFVSSSSDKSILIWRLDMSSPVQQLNSKAHEGAVVYSCLFLPNSNR